MCDAAMRSGCGMWKWNADVVGFGEMIILDRVYRTTGARVFLEVRISHPQNS